MSAALAPTWGLVLALVAAPTVAAAGLPKLPADAAMVAIVAQPEQAFANMEGMAGRVGLAPPKAAPGWLRTHPALGWTAGQIDFSRPLYVVATAPTKSKVEGVSADLLIYLPILPEANVEKIVERMSGRTTKLASRREGGYLLLSENRRRLAKRGRPRALPDGALKQAKALDVAVFFDAQRVEPEAVEAMVADGAPPRTAEDRVAKAALEVLVHMSRAATPKGELSMIGVQLAKDGLRVVSRTPLVKGSEMGGWLLSMPQTEGPILRGLPEGPMLGGFGAAWDAASTVALVKALHRQVVAKLSKADRKELAPLEAIGPELAKAFTVHPRLSVAVRPAPGDAGPSVVVVGPRVPDSLRAKVPELQKQPADPKAGVPAHARVEVDPGTYAYLVDVGDHSLVAVNVSRLDLGDLVAAVKAGHAPGAKQARYRAARAALPEALVAEAYIDAGPIADLALADPDFASFRPLARLVGGLPPVAIGVSLEGTAMRSEIFVPEGLLGLVGMAFSLATAPGAQGGPASRPASPPAKR